MGSFSKNGLKSSAAARARNRGKSKRKVREQNAQIFWNFPQKPKPHQRVSRLARVPGAQVYQRACGRNRRENRQRELRHLERRLYFVVQGALVQKTAALKRFYRGHGIVDATLMRPGPRPPKARRTLGRKRR